MAIASVCSVYFIVENKATNNNNNMNNYFRYESFRMRIQNLKENLYKKKTKKIKNKTTFKNMFHTNLKKP